MKKVASFDLEGVVVYQHTQFSNRLVERQGEDIRPAVDEFFGGIFRQVMIGEARLSASLEPYLDRFHWEDGVEGLLDFWFADENNINPEVLSLIQEVRRAGLLTLLVTDNPAERVSRLWNGEGLTSYFDARYVSGESGVKKSSPKLWETIAKDWDVRSSDIFFVDDDVENIKVALEAGVHAKLYTNTEILKADLGSFLQS